MTNQELQTELLTGSFKTIRNWLEEAGCHGHELVNLMNFVVGQGNFASKIGDLGVSS